MNNKVNNSILKLIPHRLLVLTFGLFCLAKATTGYAADFAVIKQTPEQQEQVQVLAVTLQLDPHQVISGSTPKARLFEKYNPVNSYQVKVESVEKKPEQFIITSETLPAGEYRLIIDIPVHRTLLGINTGRQTKTFTHDFTVHQRLASSCFNFNDKTKDVMGWTSSHVFIFGREEPISKPTCPGLFYVNTSWPAKLNETTEGGSMFVPISGECFPKTSNQMSEDPDWHFSLRSPDLTTRTDWQQIKSINFRVATNKIPIKVLPEVHYIIGTNKTSTIFKDVLRKKHELAGEGWNTIDYPFLLPKEAIVTGVELHFYGVPEQTVGTEVNSIFVDGICPNN